MVSSVSVFCLGGEALSPYLCGFWFSLYLIKKVCFEYPSCGVKNQVTDRNKENLVNAPETLYSRNFVGTFVLNISRIYANVGCL